MDAVVIGVVVTDITAKPIAAQDTWKDKQRIGGISLSTGGDAANQAQANVAEAQEKVTAGAGTAQSAIADVRTKLGDAQAVLESAVCAALA